MEVVHDHEQCTAMRHRLEEGGNAVEQTESCLGRIERRQRGQVRHPVADLRHQFGDGGCSAPEGGVQGVRGAVAHQLPQHLHP